MPSLSPEGKACAKPLPFSSRSSAGPQNIPPASPDEPRVTLEAGGEPGELGVESSYPPRSRC